MVLPPFSTPFRGPGVLPATIVLAVMRLPTVTALSRDALRAVPGKLRMAAYGLGATRWEMILAVILPSARRGLFAAVVLAFGRALGETRWCSRCWRWCHCCRWCGCWSCAADSGCPGVR